MPFKRETVKTSKLKRVESEGRRVIEQVSIKQIAS